MRVPSICAIAYLLLSCGAAPEDYDRMVAEERAEKFMEEIRKRDSFVPWSEQQRLKKILTDEMYAASRERACK